MTATTGITSSLTAHVVITVTVIIAVVITSYQQKIIY